MSFSKSQVFNLTRGLDSDLDVWRDRPLQSHYSVMYVDGMYTKVREANQVVKQVVFMVLGVDSSGGREVLGTAVVHETNETENHDMFDCLKARGGVEWIWSSAMRTTC
ncbi:MAG: transposase [Calditrichaeota bacterium]|nr:transposase [Calditrichota bacterium]MCB9472802.1 transposase [Candidatus Delongbacteria bacterium]